VKLACIEDVLGQLQELYVEDVADDAPPLSLIHCRHCGARYWHELGHLATDGKIAGGPCCFGHEVLTLAKYPIEADARAAWGKWQCARPLSIPETCDRGELVMPI